MKWKLRTQVDAQYYPSICLARLIGSFFVVTIHLAPFYKDAALQNFLVQDWLARVAVPFFFASSGYFLYRRTTLEQFSLGPTKAFALRMLRIYVIWSVIYFPLSVKTYIGDEKGLLHSILWYFRSFLFEGSYYHLWYLPAVILAVLLISFLLSKKVSPRQIMLAAAAFYLVGLLGQSWFGLIRPLQTGAPLVWRGLKLAQKVIRTTRNGLFDGFLFTGVGMLFAFYEIKLPRKTALTGFLASMLLVLAEGLMLERAGFIRMHDAYLTLPLALFFAFALALELRLPMRPFYKDLQQLGTLIYFLHPWIGPAPFDHLWPEQLARSLRLSSYLPGVLLNTLIISTIIVFVTHLPGFGWIRKLYQ